MASNTKQKRVPLRERLRGKKSFVLGPYKSAHVAHSYASQVRRMLKGGEFLVREVAVNAEAKTVRVAQPK